MGAITRMDTVRMDTDICAMSLTSLTPVERVISAASCLYLLSSVSMSSATCGNGFAALRFQKKSLLSRSYERLVGCAGGAGDAAFLIDSSEFVRPASKFTIL